MINTGNMLVRWLAKYNLMLFLLALLCSCATSNLGKSGQKKINGKTFVIIGASSGIGRGVAEKLGQYHANVVLAARRTNALETVAENIINAGGRALVVTTDVSRDGDVERLADTAVKTFGKIDVWINDAAVFAIGRFWDIPLQDHLRVIDVNLKGYLRGSYIAIGQFRRQGYGTLINIASGESEVPIAYHSSYAATKAGIRSLGNLLNEELRLAHSKKIKVISIEPWTVDTPIWEHAANYSGGTARSAAMDPPRKVVNAIIWSSLHPRKELPVGWKARLSVSFHRLFPHFTERLAANLAHRYQYTTAPPAPATNGNLFEPMNSGSGVEGGVRERMKRENHLRKNRKH
jgi:short-subunit dehydrogenase